MTSQHMMGSEALVRALEKEKVEYIFGIPGHGNMHILEALYRDSSIKFMLTRHEQGAAHIADGYARASGKVGVCLSSVGAGAANMLMGIGAASGGSSPILAISGGIISSMYGKGQLQATERPENKTDQNYGAVLQPLVKKAWVVERPELIPEVTHRAIKVATSGRPGPVAMEIPWDVQCMSANMRFYPPEQHGYARGMRADEQATRRAARMLREARFPVIVAGNGALSAGASGEVRALAELLGAPVVTSFMSKGILPEDHPLSAGMVGWLGNPVAHELIRERADVVLVVGFRFSDESTSFWTEGLPFVRQNQFIQIDLVPEEIGRNYPVELGLLGDAKAVLSDLMGLLIVTPPREERSEAARVVAGLKRAAWAQLKLPQGDMSPVEPYQIAMTLRKALPRESIVIPDTGNHAHYFSAFFPAYGPGSMMCPGSWTPMGFSPAAVLGAKLARPDIPCVSVTGDGGFFMSCQEVITAVEWNLPVVWIVFNNSTLNAIRIGQKDDYGGHIIGTEFGKTADFAMMARSFCAEGVRVERTSQLREAIDFALTCGKPCVVDVITEHDPIMPQTAGDFLTPGQHIPAPWPRGSRPNGGAKRKSGGKSIMLNLDGGGTHDTKAGPT